MPEGEELTGKEIVIVFHEGKDDYVLLNNLASIKKDSRLLKVIAGSIDFYDVCKDDDGIKASGISLSLTKIREEKKNISEFFLGDEIKKEIAAFAHDSLFDAKLLRRVWRRYFTGIASKMNTYLLASNLLLNNAKEFMRKQEVKRGNKIVVGRVFNGWGEWSFN